MPKIIAFLPDLLYNSFIKIKNISKKDTTQFAWPIIGNSAALDFLDRSHKLGNIAQTYIFSGAAGLGKTLTAHCFAERLIFPEKLSNCGDCHIVERLEGKKNISVDQIREFINILGMSSFSGGRKVGIIKAAETLSLEAANSLLKLLEEPQADVVLILITSSLDSILPTIISRSQVVNFFPVATDLIRDYLCDNLSTPLELANNLAALSGGRPGRALQFLEDHDFYENYLQQVQSFLGFFKSDISERLKNISLLFDDGEAVVKAAQTIDAWEAVARDLVLSVFNNNDLVAHRNFLPELKEAVSDLDLTKITGFFPIFDKAKQYLAANVMPKNVLEYIAINI